MTKIENHAKSVVEDIENSSYGARELAASQLTNSAIVLLETALSASGMSQKDLASELNLGESRISQVFNGNGNIKLTTLARYLRAMGYQAELVVTPVKDGDPALARKRMQPPVV